MPCARQVAACAQARSTTQSVSPMMSSVDSAAGTNAPGGRRPRDRVLPADERLDARDRAVGGADLGLVVEHELAVVDRVAELGDERQPVGVEALLARRRT